MIIYQEKKKGVIRVLALDDSTSTTGWCVFDDSVLVGFGKISMNNQDVIKRMSGMRQWMLSAIHNWKPDVVGVEDIQLQRRDRTVMSVFKVLAQLQGVLLVTLAEEDGRSNSTYCDLALSLQLYHKNTRGPKTRSAKTSVWLVWRRSHPG